MRVEVLKDVEPKEPETVSYDSMAQTEGIYSVDTLHPDNIRIIVLKGVGTDPAVIYFHPSNGRFEPAIKKAWATHRFIKMDETLVVGLKNG